MNKLLCVIMLAVVSGCATTAKYDAKLATWVGSNEAQLIQGWGSPNSTFALSDGGRVLSYTRSSGTASETTYNGLNRSLDTETTSYWCKTDFTLNRDNVVTNYRWEGNACRSR